jgi:acyl-[acyl-carrier-protein]-phospholipid O-acyltransferase/long-chain-fatty-acid--[acyl-carrier-protein] ligase
MRSLLSSSLKKIFSSIPSFSKTDKHALTYLNMTQFLGVINDNVFKFVMAFLLIDSLGHAEASSILSATGAIYVIPFLIFSSSAGILADRFSKQKLLVVMKVAEMALMALAIFAFASKSVWACYSLLFCLSIHSAMFGPSKYGIIPELVPADSVSRANGLVTSFTYLAIIVGTFLASFLTEVTDRNFVLIAIFCLAVAVGGFFSALAVKQTSAQGSKKTINLLFLREIYKTLKYTRTVRHLLPSIFGSAFFLLIGAFTQLNIIPFALQSLNLSEVAGGYLFLATALGIALGSFLAGRASRKRIELGLSCIAGFGIALFFILLAIFSTHLYTVIACLIAIGILGGAFIVPFDTFIQLNSDDERRGQTIAAANFLSFTGVLFASIALYFFNQICGLSSAASFGVMGVITLIVTIALSLRLSDMFLPYFSRKIFQHLRGFRCPNTEAIEQSEGTILILEKATWTNALLLSGTMPDIHFLIPSSSKRWHWIHQFFYSFHKVAEEKNIEEILQTARTYAEKGITPCLMLEKTLPQKPQSSTNSFLDFFKRSSTQLLYVRKIKDPDTNRLTFQFEK